MPYYLAPVANCMCPPPQRLYRNSSSRPSPAKRDASRDLVRLDWSFTGFRISLAVGELVRNDGFGEL